MLIIVSSPLNLQYAECLSIQIRSALRFHLRPSVNMVTLANRPAPASRLTAIVLNWLRLRWKTFEPFRLINSSELDSLSALLLPESESLNGFSESGTRKYSIMVEKVVVMSFLSYFLLEFRVIENILENRAMRRKVDIKRAIYMYSSKNVSTKYFNLLKIN